MPARLSFGPLIAPKERWIEDKGWGEGGGRFNRLIAGAFAGSIDGNLPLRFMST